MKQVVLAVGSVLAVSSVGFADPLRLRADALASTTSPVGLLSLEADAATGPLSAEAVVWMGDGGGDVLVIALHGKAMGDRVRGTVGRFVSMLGAMRPVHVDGASARVRLPHRLDVEVVAGIPVVPQLGGRTWDWLAGGRVARRLGDWGAVGVAVLEQREAGRLATEEVGADLGIAIGKRGDVGAKLAYDLANPGVAEATTSASYRRGALRGELYASYRAASHLVPATSLFSVLGDVPAVRTGATLAWRAAPRLDVIGELGARRVDADTAPLVVARARLRLDDRGKSVLAAELRRDGVADDAWTGARGSARVALPHAFTIATELELVIPDHDRGRGEVWPWGLVALSRDTGVWSAALAVEASASPSDRYRVDALAQLGRRWGTP